MQIRHDKTGNDGDGSDGEHGRADESGGDGGIPDNQPGNNTDSTAYRLWQTQPCLSYDLVDQQHTDCFGGQ